jgi:hypothetical protein
VAHHRHNNHNQARGGESLPVRAPAYKYREAKLGSCQKPRVYNPLDLEIIDYVYEVAWEQVKARDLFRDTSRDEERKLRLRRLIFVLAKPGKVDFDTLCDRVMANLTEPWAIPQPRRRRSSTPEVGA